MAESNTKWGRDRFICRHAKIPVKWYFVKMASITPPAAVFKVMPTPMFPPIKERRNEYMRAEMGASADAVGSVPSTAR